MTPDFGCRVALVTGGTAGIGKEIALGLAHRGVSVTVVGRYLSRGNAAVAELRQRSENPRIDFIPADLTSMEEVARVARLVGGRPSSLHYLVHSAGFVRGRRALTVDGVESNFAINYLSRFRLTLDLLPCLRACSRPNDPGRILMVGGAAQVGRVHFADVNLTRNFSTIKSVLQFQAANDMFAVELARRLQSATNTHAPVHVNVIKYGVVTTAIRTGFPAWLRMLSLLLDPIIGQSPTQAAEPALNLLLSEEFANSTGRLYMSVGRFKEAKTRAYVADPAHGAQLWSLSAKLSREFRSREPGLFSPH